MLFESVDKVTGKIFNRRNQMRSGMDYIKISFMIAKDNLLALNFYVQHGLPNLCKNGSVIVSRFLKN